MKEFVLWIQFWSAWFGFWGMILGLEIGLYQIAIADASKLLAKEFVSSVRSGTLFGRSFFITSQLADVIFGPRLFSRRAYWTGFGLSVGLFAVAFAIAIGSTEYMHQGFVSRIFDWSGGDEKEPNLLHAYTIIFTIGGVLAWLCLEPILAAKTRALARLLRSTTHAIGVAILLLVDLGSTLLTVILFSPFVFVCVVWLFLFVSSDMLNQHMFVLSSGETNAAFVEKPYFTGAYRTFLRATYYDVFQHLSGHAHAYFVLEARGFLDRGCSLHYEPRWLNAIVTGCLSDIPGVNGTQTLHYVRITFPLTSMLISSVATTIWMVSCAVVLLSAKLISAPRRAFLWIHNHPLALWRWFIVPTTLIALAGGILLPLLFPSLFSN